MDGLELRETTQYGKALFAGRCYSAGDDNRLMTSFSTTLMCVAAFLPFSPSILLRMLIPPPPRSLASLVGETVLTEKSMLRIIEVETFLRGANEGVGGREGDGRQGKAGVKAGDAVSAHPAVSSWKGGCECLKLQDEMETLRTMMDICDRHKAEKGTANLLHSFLWHCDEATQVWAIALSVPN